MGILKVAPFDAPPTVSGLSIAIGESKGKPFIRIGISRAAQEAHFGRALVPGEDGIVLTLTDDPAHRHLMGVKPCGVSVPEALPLRSGSKGSVSLRVRPWLQVAGKRPATAMPVVNAKVDGGGISVRLPDWAKPAADPRPKVTS